MAADRPRPTLHRLTLRFADPALEGAYQVAALGEALLPFRVAGVLAIAVFSIVALVAVTLGPTRARLDGHFGLERRGEVDIKGKGPTETWLVVGPIRVGG